jgi:Mce-associated membrane protein
MRRPTWHRPGTPKDTEPTDETEQTQAATVAVDEIDENIDDNATPVAEPNGDAAAIDSNRDPRWSKVVAYAVLPGLAVLLAAGIGYVKWQDISAHGATSAGADSVRAATDGTIALLSYKPETVEKDLAAARDRMTGQFLDSYTALTKDVVIPGSKQKQISAVATVPAAASVQASSNHAVVLLFVDQSVVIKDDAPTSTASTVRVTLDRIDGRWLISHFDPV